MKHWHRCKHRLNSKIKTALSHTSRTTSQADLMSLTPVCERPITWDDLAFRQLKYAIAVADQLSFTRAAIHLHIDQGRLSKQIQRLKN